LPSQEIHAVFPSPKLVPTKVTGLIKWLQGKFGEAWWTGEVASSSARQVSRAAAAPLTAGTDG
ncbi:MAG TPA: hypothetical protein VGA59_00610, partial [Ramlibacter sp.]